MKESSRIVASINRAHREYRLFSDSKILVAVSGGKDSMALLSLLAERNLSVLDKLHISAVHIAINKRTDVSDFISDYCKIHKISFFSVSAASTFEEGDCHRCTWVRRRTLFSFASEQNYPLIAFGHHYDDIVETVLMNLLFNGEISSMKPRQEFFNGKISIIRPLCLVKEAALKKYTELAGIPKMDYNCAGAVTSRRAQVKDFLNSLGRSRNISKANLFKFSGMVLKPELCDSDSIQTVC